jgi:hypothetical protein
LDGRAKETKDGCITELVAVEYLSSGEGGGGTSRRTSKFETGPPPSRADQAWTVVAAATAITMIAGCLVVNWWAGLVVGGLIGAAGALLWRPRFVGDEPDWPTSHVILTDELERGMIIEARSAVTTITRAWPSLRSITVAPGPDEVLGRAVWELARVQHERQTAREVQWKLRSMLSDADQSSRTYAEFAARIKRAADVHLERDGAVWRHLTRLTDLARLCEHFVQEHAATDGQARGERLTASADAILAAYRTLHQPPA